MCGTHKLLNRGFLHTVLPVPMRNLSALLLWSPHHWKRMYLIVKSLCGDCVEQVCNWSTRISRVPLWIPLSFGGKDCILASFESHVSFKQNFQFPTFRKKLQKILVFCFQFSKLNQFMSNSHFCTCIFTNFFESQNSSALELRGIFHSHSYWRFHVQFGDL